VTGRELVVVDASAMVVLLVDGGADGEWVADRLRGTRLAAPQLMPFEVTNVLRRQVIRRALTEPQGRVAREAFGLLPVELWACALLADRMWELRDNASAYDASYLALAERVGAPLITGDRRLATVPGIQCPVVLVPETPLP